MDINLIEFVKLIDGASVSVVLGVVCFVLYRRLALMDSKMEAVFKDYKDTLSENTRVLTILLDRIDRREI